MASASLHAAHFLLVADDNPADRDLLRLGFEECGLDLDVLEVADGDAAVYELASVEGAPERQPCAVILDVNMPRSTGLEVLAWMRDRDAYRETPAFVMTSTQRPSDLARIAELGGRYVAKPQTLPELLVAVEALGRELDACDP